MENHGESWRIMEKHGESWKIMENHGESPWKIMENHGESWKNMENHGKSWGIMEHIGTSSYNSRFPTGVIVENRRLQACVDDDAAFQAEAAKAGERPGRR